MTIRAPLSGVVLERAVTLGTVVNPADNLILLSDLASLWVVGEVPEREASLVSVGQSADIEVAAFPGERFEAEVFHIVLPAKGSTPLCAQPRCDASCKTRTGD